MEAGLEVFDENGDVMLSLTGRYPQVVDVIELSSVGTPGSRNYPNIPSGTLGFILYQGGSRARIVSKSGTTISWAFVNNFVYRAFGGTPRIVVTSG